MLLPSSGIFQKAGENVLGSALSLYYLVSNICYYSSIKIVTRTLITFLHLRFLFSYSECFFISSSFEILITNGFILLSFEEFSKACVQLIILSKGKPKV